MSAEQKKNKAYLAKQRRELERDAHRRTVAQVRERLQQLRTARRVALGTVRSLCKRGKLRARAAVKALRDRELERLRKETQAIRREACHECTERRRRVNATIKDRRDKLEAHRREAERTKRTLAAIDRKHAVKERAASTALERRQESDDAVLRNIGPELAAVWKRHRKHFAQAPANKSRTEAFLEWVEANPDEVLAEQASRGEALAARDIAELHAAERSLRRPRKAGLYSSEEARALRRLGIDPDAPRQAARGAIPF